MRDFEIKGKKTEKTTFIYTIIKLANKHNLDSSCVKKIICKES